MIELVPRESEGAALALERVARAFGDEASPDPRIAGGDPVVLGVDREIALVLSHLDRLRREQESAIERFSELECGVGSELLQMDAQQWWYAAHREERWRDRQGLKARLASLTIQRLGLESAFEQRIRAHEDRLFILVQRRGAVTESSESGGYASA